MLIFKKDGCIVKKGNFRDNEQKIENDIRKKQSKTLTYRCFVILAFLCAKYTKARCCRRRR